MASPRRRRPQLKLIRVRDCMHHGILSCAADAPLGDVAAMMVTNRVHAVAVHNGEGLRPAGVISDLDVVAVAATGEEPLAIDVAVTAPLAISDDESLARAVEVMSERGVSHLVVVEAASGFPTGILSTLDVAAVYAGPGDDDQ